MASRAPRTLLSAPPTERVGRYPKHPFNIAPRPFLIRPFMLAPVLPGESLTSAYFESRVVTDPIVNPIIGWKKEYFWFYIRMSDLLNDQIKGMFTDPTNSELEGEDADLSVWYTAKGGINWARMAMERVLIHYFRDDGEDPWAHTSPAGLPVAKVKDLLFTDSLTDESDMPVGDEIIEGQDMQDFERLMMAFEQLRAMGMTEMSYEDYLRSHGIVVADPTQGKPELLWHLSDWQYPSNTIDPTNGTPRSAVSWVFKNTLRKPKLFKEPGFVMGVTVTRPKMYLGGLRGSAAGFMNRSWDWMPAMLAAMTATRLKHFEAGTGPLGDRSGTAGGTESEYWLDMADILVHGDQMTDQLLLNTLAPQAALPYLAPLPSWADGEDALNKEYLSMDNLTALFVGPGVSVREDGVCNLSIKGKTVDLTNMGVGQL